ncbi:unnamed protein product, partial [marine sediment metagenome]
MQKKNAQYQGRSISSMIRIYINLVTRESFSNRLELLPPPFGIYIKLKPEQRKGKRVPFKFEGIPKGNYFIVSFQDLNKNEKLDRDTSGWPVEPYGTYKTFEFVLQWDRDKFLVDKDIKGIEINIE